MDHGHTLRWRLTKRLINYSWASTAGKARCKLLQDTSWDLETPEKAELSSDTLGQSLFSWLKCCQAWNYITLSNFYPLQQGNIIIYTCCTWNMISQVTFYKLQPPRNQWKLPRVWPALLVRTTAKWVVDGVLFLCISSAWSGLDPIRWLQLSHVHQLVLCCVDKSSLLRYWVLILCICDIVYHNSTLVGAFCWTLLLLWKFFQLSCTHTFLACTHQML